jgi:hypothetical protein
MPERQYYSRIQPPFIPEQGAEAQKAELEKDRGQNFSSYALEKIYDAIQNHVNTPSLQVKAMLFSLGIAGKFG